MFRTMSPTSDAQAFNVVRAVTVPSILFHRRLLTKPEFYELDSEGSESGAEGYPVVDDVRPCFQVRPLA